MNSRNPDLLEAQLIEREEMAVIKVGVKGVGRRAFKTDLC